MAAPKNYRHDYILRWMEHGRPRVWRSKCRIVRQYDNGETWVVRWDDNEQQGEEVWTRWSPDENAYVQDNAAR